MSLQPAKSTHVRVPHFTLNVPHPITFFHATTTNRRVSAMISLPPSISASRHHSRQLNDNSTLSTLLFSFFLFHLFNFYFIFCCNFKLATLHVDLPSLADKVLFCAPFSFQRRLLLSVTNKRGFSALFICCGFEAEEILMAEVLTKASFVSSLLGSSQRRHRRVSTVPDTCTIGGSPSLKFKSQILRSRSSSSEFQGKKLLFHVNRGPPNRVSLRLRASTGAQVCNITTLMEFALSLIPLFCGFRTFLLVGVLLIFLACSLPSSLLGFIEKILCFFWRVFGNFL